MFKTLYTQNNAHDDGVWAVAWAKHETHDSIVTGSLDDTVRTWKWTGNALERQQQLQGHKLGVLAVSIDASGTRAVSSSIDGQILVWDLTSGQLVKAFNGGTNNTWTVAISSDGSYVAAGSNTGDIYLYPIGSADADAAPSKLQTGGAFIGSVAFSPDSRRLAAAAWDGKIFIFNLEQGTLIHTIQEGHVKPVRALAFSPDNNALLTGCDDGLAKLFDVATGEAKATFAGHASCVLSVAWCPTNTNRFASSSSDKTIKVWDVAERQCLHTFQDYADQVWGVAFDRTGTKLVGISDDQSIRIHECPAA